MRLRDLQGLETAARPFDAELSPGSVVAQLRVRMLLLRREAPLEALADGTPCVDRIAMDSLRQLCGELGLGRCGVELVLGTGLLLTLFLVLLGDCSNLFLQLVHALVEVLRVMRRRWIRGREDHGRGQTPV